MASEHNTPSKTSSYPVALNRLNQLATDACDSTFRTATTYNHSQASSWNTSIINSILQSLISATSSSNAPPSYKYAVTSTIIQHTSPPAPRPPTADDFPPPPSSTASASEATLSGGGDAEPAAGSDGRGVGKTGSGGKAGGGAVARRGMHSATGCFWNQEKDGMWSFKYEGGEAKGFDVVVSVVWISI